MFSADEHNILINIYASHADRDLSEQQLNELSNHAVTLLNRSESMIQRGNAV
jgi:hypothetical protein